MKLKFRLWNCAVASLAILSVAGFTACGDDAPEKPVADELILKGTPLSFVAEEGSVTFTVTFNGKNVTSEAVITNTTAQTPVTGATWTTAMKGPYNFQATYAGQESNVVAVTVRDKTDPLPTEKFFRRTLLTKFTATWCEPCAEAQGFFGQLEPADAEHFLVVAAHQEDWLVCPAGSILSVYVGVKTFPTWSYNLATTVAGTGEGGITFSSIKKQITATENTYPALCGVKATSTLEGSKAKIRATATFQKGGEYNIACVLTENGIAKTEVRDVMDIYDHVLRKGVTDMRGVAIEPAPENGEERTFDFETEIDAAWKAENCQFVVYVLREVRDDQYVVNNGVECPVGGSVEYKYEVK